MEKYKLVLEEDSKKVYGITNTECPICGTPNNVVLMPIVKLGNVGYCVECYYNSVSSFMDN